MLSYLKEEEIEIFLDVFNIKVNSNNIFLYSKFLLY